ncbi:MAG: hypothetical protein HQ502_17070 [Alphaproteobacteria bacterium]|nr:hypothetical protein [Alphaproteobacteria bacterium]
MPLINYLLPAIALVVVLGLLRPAIREARFWRATVTPLASIIGSGFLVMAPLLAQVAGGDAFFAMLAIVGVAYLIGEVIRFNIRYAEPALLQGGGSMAPSVVLRVGERFSNIALALAYVVSVAFYVRLLASFVLDGVGVESATGAKFLTTLVLSVIGIAGWRFGLRGLERLEEYSVSIKLAVIAALLFGLLHLDITNGFALNGLQAEPQSLELQLRKLAGMLLVVQGFETSRYLGAEYSGRMRIQSMRFAQILSAGVYLVFVLSILPLLHFLAGGKPDETAIIHLVGHAAIVLPVMLIFAAVASQFGAAVGDTLGAGGLAEEESRGYLTAPLAYLVVTGLGVVLVWTTNVFEIITLASRAFAVYYLAQAVVALWLAHGLPRLWQRIAYGALFGLTAVMLAGVALFAVPVG